MSDPVQEQPATAPTPPPIPYSPFWKILSGRFILTVVGAFCFYIITNTICQLILEKKEQITITDAISILSSILIVVSNIFTFYFVRKGMEAKVNGQGTEE